MHIKSKKSFLRKSDHLQQSLEIEKSKHYQSLYAEAPKLYIERLQHLNQKIGQHSSMHCKTEEF